MRRGESLIYEILSLDNAIQMIKLTYIWRKMDSPIFKFALREDLQNHPELLPTRAEPKATGWDVRAANSHSIVIKPLQYAKIPLGFRAFCPEGWWLELKPRSSSFTKKSLHALYGTIDTTFEGEMIFACQYLPELGLVKTGNHPDKIDIMSIYCNGNQDLIIFPGDAIGQLIPIKRQEMIVESISNEEYDSLCRERNSIRGAGGFGSTGR